LFITVKINRSTNMHTMIYTVQRTPVTQDRNNQV